MVAVVAGKGLGLFNSSLNTLGGAGTMGQAGIGQAGGRAYVNAYSGNLVIQFSDEQLAGISQDLFALRTYNSQGALNGATDWRWDGERKIVLNYVAAEIEGDPPVLASITRTTGDGRETTYTLEGNRYVSTDGDGAHDYLSKDENTGEWVWVDGSTRLSERYQLQAAAEGTLPTNGRLVSQVDASGNRITFAYDAAGRLETVTDIGSGQALTYTYDAVTGRVTGLKTQFKVVNASGQLQTITPLQVAYEYDALGRLAKVRTEVTERTSASQAGTYDTLDGNVSETVYTYDGTSTRIASVTQGDGTRVSFTYYGDGRIHTVTDAAGTTTYEYETAERTSDEAGLEHVTYITNGLGQKWTYVSGDNGRLIEILSPGNDGTSLVTRFKYDADGNVTSVTDGRGNVLTYEYDDNGNRTLERDATGAVVRRAYNASNQVTSETRYTARATKDENGNWVDPTTGGQSTRYVYDSSQRLRFVVGGQGDVTEYRYNVAGLATHVIQYAGGVFTPPATSLLEGQLMAWVAAQDKTKTTLTENVYDYRGNLSKSTSFAQTDLNGKGVLTAAATVTEFVYDAHGQLLQTIAVRGTDRSSRTTLSSLVYDGLGRVIARTDANGTTSTAYSTAHTITVTTSAGLTQTQAYDEFGRLLSVIETAAGATPRDVRYFYDAAGRQVVVQDPTGVRSYTFYDDLGRVSARVDGVGAVVKYDYNENGQLEQETRYALLRDTSDWFNVETGAVTVTDLEVDVLPAADSANDRVTHYQYDDAGRLTHSTDAGNVGTELQYDGRGQLVQTQVAGATGRTTRYFYDASGRQVGVLDAAGNLTENLYNAAGQLIQVKRYSVPTAVGMRASGTLTDLRPKGDIGARSTFNFYDAQGRIVGTLDEKQFFTEYTYDNAANTQQVIRYATAYTTAVNSLTTFAAIKAAVSAGAKQASTTTFDAMGRVQTQTNAEGTVTAFVYDTAGRLVRQTMALGTSDERSTLTRYDAFGRVIARLGGEGAAGLQAGATAAQVEAYIQANIQNGERYDYDAAGRKAHFTDAAGNVTAFYYDADGRLTHTINGAGEVTETAYNAFGEVEESTRFTSRLDGSARDTAAGSAQRFTGGLLTTTLKTLVNAIRDVQTDRVEQFDYNKRGLLATRTDAEGYTTTFDYTDFGQLLRETKLIDAATSRSVVSEFEYDKRGLATKATRDVGGLNLVTRTEYDVFGRVVKQTDASGKSSVTSYESAGRIIAVTDSLLSTRRTEFDAFDRVLRQVDATGNSTTYSYDDVNRAVTVTSPEGIVVKTYKTRAGEVLKVVDGNGNSTDYVYNKNGQLLKAVDALGNETTNSYDTAGRLLQTRNASGQRVRFEYDAANRVVTRTVDGTLANITTYEFDGQGRQVAVVEAVGSAQARRTTYDYDRLGQVLTVTVDPDGKALTTTYTYDGTGNQLTVARGSEASPALQQTTYEYDNLGRRLQETVELDNGNGLTTQYRYDASGRVTRKIDAAGNSSWYLYNAEGQLTYTVDGEGAVTRNDYDANGRVVSTVRFATPLAAAVMASYASLDVLTSVAPAADRARDQQTWFFHDKDGRLRFTVNAQGLVSENRYDANNNLVETRQYQQTVALVADATRPGATKAPVLADVQAVLGSTVRSTRFVYDVLNRTRFVVAADASVTESRYDELGHVVETRRYTTLIPSTMTVTEATLEAVLANAESQRTAYVYDAAGRLRFTIDAFNSVTEVRYDAVGRTLETIRHSRTLPAGTLLTELDVTTALHTSWSTQFNGSIVPEMAMGDLTTYPDVLSMNNGRLVLRNAQGTSATPTVYYPKTAEPYAAGKIYRAELFFGATLPRNLQIGLSNGAAGANLRQHMISFKEDGKFYVTGADGADVALGAGRINTTYVLEFETRSNGTTAYIYEKGQSRDSGWSGTIDQGAWSNVRLQISGRRANDGSYLNNEAYVDNVSVAATGNAPAADAQRTRQVYDAAGRLRFTLDAFNGVTEQVYDSVGQVVQQKRYTERLGTLPASLTESSLQSALAGKSFTRTSFVYDAAGRRIFSIDAAGGVTRTTYDATGRVIGDERFATAITLPAIVTRESIAALLPATADSVTTYVYDADGRVHFVIDSLRGVTENVYNGLDQIVQQIRYAKPVSTANLHTTAAVRAELAATNTAADLPRNTYFVYDQQGRVHFSIDPLRYVSEKRYDAFGNLVQEVRYANPITLPAALTEASVQAAVAANPNEVLWSNSFDQNFNGLEMRNPSGISAVALANGGLTFKAAALASSTSVPVTAGVYQSFQAYQGNVSYRAEVTTGASSAGRVFSIGIDNNLTSTGYRRHAITFQGGVINAEAKGAAGSSTAQVGTAKDNTTYVVEIVTDIGGSTLYVYEKGTARGAGQRLDAADWKEVRLFATTQAKFGGTNATVSLDNVSQSRVPQGTQYTYDIMGRVTEQIGDAVAVTQPTVSGAYSTTAGAYRIVTSFTYDTYGRVSTRTEGILRGASGDVTSTARTTRYVYDALDHVRFTQDALGNVTENRYDARGLLVETRQYGQAVATDTTQSEAAFAAALATATYRSTRYVYDVMGRLRYTINAANAVAEQTYDVLGRMSQQLLYSATVAANTEMTETALKAVLSRASAHRTVYAYDALGQVRYTLVAANDTTFNVTEQSYNALGQVATSTRYAGSVVLGATAEAADTAANGLTTAAVDAFKTAGTLSAVDARTTSYVYNAGGSLRYSIDALGYVSETRYDGFGQVAATYRYGTGLPGATALTEEAIGGFFASNTALVRGESYQYDLLGRRIATTDGRGYTESYSYDAYGNRTKLVNKAGEVWTYRYDALGRLLEQASPAASVAAKDGSVGQFKVVTRMAYDAFGNLVSQSEGNLRSVTDVDQPELSEPRVTEYQYDRLGRQVVTRTPGYYVMTSQTIWGMPVNTSKFVADGSIPGAFKVTTTVTYDAFGQAVRNRVQTGVNQYVDSYKVYDTAGRVQFDIDAENHVTEYGYDNFGNQTSVKRYANKLAAVPGSLGYFNAAEVDAGLLESPESDRTLTTVYDALDRKVTVLQDKVSRYVYGTGAAVTSGENDRPRTDYVYNAFGEVLRETVKDGLTTFNYYDANGNRTAQVQGDGDKFTSTVTSSWSGPVTSYAAPGDGKLEGTNYLTTYRYDAAGQMIEQTEFATALAINVLSTAVAPSMTYDPVKDRRQRFTYDELGNTVKVELLDTSYYNASTTGADLFGYQRNEMEPIYRGTGDRQRIIGYSESATNFRSNPNYSQVTGATLATMQVSYDEMGRLKTQTDAAGNVTTFTYDAHGHTKEVTLPARTSASSAANALDPFLNAVDGGVVKTNIVKASPTVNYVYNAFGQVVLETEAAGAGQAGLTTQTVTRYDAAGFVIQVVEGEAKTGTAAAGQSVHNDTNAAIVDYAVDALGRTLERSQRVEATVMKAGLNNTQEKDASVSYQFVKKQSYSYDKLGQQTATLDHYLDASNKPQFTKQSSVYNAFGEVTQKLLNGQEQAFFVYDKAGRVIRTHNSQGWSRTYYDLAGHATQVVQEGGDNPVPAPGTTNTTNDPDRVTTTVYNAFGHAIQQRLPQFEADVNGLGTLGLAMTTPVIDQAYDRWGNVLRRSETYASNRTPVNFTVYTYDKNNRVLTEVLPTVDIWREDGTKYLSNPVRETHYDRLGNVVEEVEKVSSSATTFRKRQHYYNEVGQLLMDVDATGRQTQYQVDAKGNRVASRDAAGIVKGATYDANGNIVSQYILRRNTAGSVYTSGSTYFGGNQPLIVRVITHVNRYDQAGQLYSETDGSGVIQNDVLANPVSGVPSVTSVDVGNVLVMEGGTEIFDQNWTFTITIATTVGNTRNTKFDARGNIIATRDESGTIQNYQYDANNRKTQHTDALGGWEAWSYDDYGRMKSARNLGGSTVFYFYNAFGQTVAQSASNTTIYPANGSKRTKVYVYYDNGMLKRISESTDVDGKAVPLDYSSGLYRRYDSKQHSEFDYDVAGNRVRERNWSKHFVYDETVDTGIKVVSEQYASQEIRFRYDALNRLNYLMEPGGTTLVQGGGKAADAYGITDYGQIAKTATIDSLIYGYDEVGNRRVVKATGKKQNGAVVAQEDWYKFDAEGRMLIAEGFLNASGQIVAGFKDGAGKGTVLTYNALGQRVSEEAWESRVNPKLIWYSGWQPGYDTFSLKKFTYDDQGRITTISKGTLTRAYGADTLGAITSSTNVVLKTSFEYDSRGNRTAEHSYTTTSTGAPRLDETVKYFNRGDGRLLYQQTWKYNYSSSGSQTKWIKDDTIFTGTGKDNNRWGRLFLPLSLTAMEAEGKQNAYLYRSFSSKNVQAFRITYGKTYTAFDSYKENLIIAARPGHYTGITHQYFSADGELLRAKATGGVTFDRRFSSSREGMLMNRVNASLDTQSFYYWNSKPIASLGMLEKADFDYGYTKVSDAYPPSNASTHIVGEGDTLQSIAQAVWGDSALWYLLADANGLSGDADLVRGDTLKIPNTVTNIHDNYSTFKVYNAMDVIKDITPAPLPPPPPPPKKKCGGLGAIIMVVVAVVATVLTAGAAAALGPILSGAIGAMAGSVASQLAGKAMGVVDHFSWKAVAQAGITGAIGGALGPLNQAKGLVQTVQNAAISSVQNYAINYVANKIVGIDTHFSWKDMANQAIGSMVTAGVMQKTGLDKALEKLPYGGSADAKQRWNLSTYAKGLVNSSAHAAMSDKWFGGERADYGMVAANSVASSLARDSASAMFEKDRFGNQLANWVKKNVAPDQDKGLSPWLTGKFLSAGEGKPKQTLNELLGHKLDGLNDDVAKWWESLKNSDKSASTSLGVELSAPKLNLSLRPQQIGLELFPGLWEDRHAVNQLGISILPPSDESSLEGMDAGTAAMLKGFAYSLDSGQPQFYKTGQSGAHFFLPFLIADAAGISNERLANVISFSQFPDQISETDAFTNGTRSLMLKHLFREKGYDPAKVGVLSEQALHALNGLTVQQNLQFYQQIIADYKDNDAVVGLALHGLVDSIFHSYEDENGIYRTYTAPLGHGAKGSDPDYISADQARLAKDQLIVAFETITGKEITSEQRAKIDGSLNYAIAKAQERASAESGQYNLMEGLYGPGAGGKYVDPNARRELAFRDVVQAMVPDIPGVSIEHLPSPFFRGPITDDGTLKEGRSFFSNLPPEKADELTRQGVEASVIIMNRFRDTYGDKVAVPHSIQNGQQYDTNSKIWSLQKLNPFGGSSGKGYSVEPLGGLNVRISF